MFLVLRVARSNFPAQLRKIRSAPNRNGKRSVPPVRFANVTRLMLPGGVNGSVTVCPLPVITTGGTGVAVAGIGLGVALGAGVFVGAGVAVGAGVFVGTGASVGAVVAVARGASVAITAVGSVVAGSGAPHPVRLSAITRIIKDRCIVWLQSPNAKTATPGSGLGSATIAGAGDRVVNNL